MAALQRLTHDIDVADTLERVINAAVGHVDDHLLDRVGMILGIDEVGSTELTRQLELVRVHVNGNDTAGFGHLRTLDHRQTDGSQAKYGNGGTRLNLGRVEYRADTGGHAATKQADLVQRRFLGHNRQGDLGHYGVLAESRAPHVVVQRLAIERKARGTIGHQPLTLGRAHGTTQVGLAREAEFTLATLSGVERNDMVTRLDAGDALTHRFDNTGAFMTQYRGEQAFRVSTGKRVSIRMANTGRHHTYQYLSRLGVLNVNLGQFKGLARSYSNGGTRFHGRLLLLSNEITHYQSRQVPW